MAFRKTKARESFSQGEGGEGREDTGVSSQWLDILPCVADVENLMRKSVVLNTRAKK